MIDAIEGEGVKSLDEYIRLAAKGGNTKSGVILGIRMSLLGLQQVKLESPAERHHNLIVIVETDRCLPDAVELVTGCRLGNRALKFQDMGKLAATFVNLKTGCAVRIAARESANERAQEMFPSLETEAAFERAYQILSADQLFHVSQGRVRIAPEDVPGYHAPRVICSACGESIAFGREIADGDRILCRACSGSGYFEAEISEGASKQ